MKLSSKQLKKVPIPWMVSIRGEDVEEKLVSIIRESYEIKFGMRTDLNSSERKSWGLFLSERGVFWELRIPSCFRPKDGWEKVSSTRIRPILDDPVSFKGYVTNRETAMRILVLGFLA